MDELFQIIGRLYIDIYRSQKFLEGLQEQIKTKDSEILSLKAKLMTGPKDSKENKDFTH